VGLQVWAGFAIWPGNPTLQPCHRLRGEAVAKREEGAPASGRYGGAACRSAIETNCSPSELNIIVSHLGRFFLARSAESPTNSDEDWFFSQSVILADLPGLS
jgi:hypothetical protein